MADALTINQVDCSRHHLNAGSHLETPLDSGLPRCLHGSRHLRRHVGQFYSLAWFGIAQDIRNHEDGDIISRGASALRVVQSHGYGVVQNWQLDGKARAGALSQKARVASESW